MTPAVSALISLDAFLGNLQAIRRRVAAGTALCPAVKANGYGHGIALLLPVLEKTGVEGVAVAHLEEGLKIRELGWRRAILVLGAPVVGENDGDCRVRAREAIAAGLQCTVSSLRELQALAEATGSLKRPASIQIKVDTGMGRMGVPAREAVELVMQAARTPGIEVSGVYTHFATADEPDLVFAQEQLAGFAALVDTLRGAHCPVKSFHAANSAAIFRLPQSHFDMVRPGLAVYGYWGGPEQERPGDLKPILRLVTRIAAVRRLPGGSSVGYGRTFHLERDTTVGVLPIGYADGFRRCLSNRGMVTIEARRGMPRSLVPIVGRVSMDQVSINLDGVQDVQSGDVVTVLDDAVDAPNSVEAVARELGSIPYEITCAMGSRISRISV